MGTSSGINTWLTIILVVIGGLMTFLIMLQEGKGGGLAALGGTKAAGIEGVTNPIRRATGWMAGIFFALAVVLGIVNRPTQEGFKVDGAEKPTEAVAPEKAPTADGKPAAVVA